MDPDKRSALIARRDQARQSANDKAIREAFAPALDALDAAGETYRLAGLDERTPWQPSWLDTPASALPWERLKPDVWELVEPGSYFDERRASLAAKILATLICDSADIRIVYDGQAQTLILAPAIALRHVASLLAIPASSIWFSAPPNDWLLDVQRDQLFARKK